MYLAPRQCVHRHALRSRHGMMSLPGTLSAYRIFHSMVVAKSFIGGFGEAKPPRHTLSGGCRAAMPHNNRQSIGVARGFVPRAPGLANAMHFHSTIVARSSRNVHNR